MVDFNSEGTIGAQAVDIQRVSILQRRYDFIEAFESWKAKRFAGADAGIHIVRARLGSLFSELQATLRRRLPDEKYTLIKKACLNGSTEDEIREVFYTINEELDKMNLIKIDGKQAYNFKIAEEDNKSMGL